MTEITLKVMLNVNHTHNSLMRFVLYTYKSGPLPRACEEAFKSSQMITGRPRESSIIRLFISKRILEGAYI